MIISVDRIGYNRRDSDLILRSIALDIGLNATPFEPSLHRQYRCRQWFAQIVHSFHIQCVYYINYTKRALIRSI